MSSVLFHSLKGLVLAEYAPKSVLKGAEMAQIPVLSNAWILSENGRIAGFGTMENCPARADELIDGTGRFVLPAWCDSHTHLVFAAYREGEFVDRINGLTYEEIAERGGGILNSARRMADASEEALFEAAWQRLEEVIAMGTGAIEIKSGYGLSTESELKMLRVIRRIKEKSPIPVKATFLGAHAFPAEFKARRRGYMDLLIQEMLPLVAGEGLADYIDVFCDRGFFTPDETTEILEAGARFGLKAKIHANELGLTGGVQAGVAIGAISVDHLEYCGPEEIACLQTSETMPVLLPACAFFLGLPYAPAREMIRAGLPVTLATDYNPGSTPSGNMPFVVSLACIKMKMLPEEAIAAATLNGARAMEMEREMGSVALGKRASLLLTRPISSLAYLPYAFGTNTVDRVFLGENTVIGKN